MKYLQLYESYKPDDIKSEIMECFYDLVEDNEFFIQIDERGTSLLGTGFDISIGYAPNEKYWSSFAYSTVKPYIDRLEQHIGDRYSVELIETVVGHSTIDMSKWVDKPDSLSTNDVIFRECKIYIVKK